jgi:electron transport complex protein RnfD
MAEQKLFVVSYSPFLHNGSSVRNRSLNIIMALMPALIMGIYRFGLAALAVVALSISSAMIWELIMNRLMGRPESISDGNAALTGLIFALLMPAVTPWWVVITGTFIAIVIGKQVFGGIGCNPLNPALVAMAMLMLSWKGLLDFDAALVDYHFDFYSMYPLTAAKHFGASTIHFYNLMDLFTGRQAGGIGAVFGLGLLAGGVYLIIRGHIRWEIPFSFLVSIFLTAMIFNMVNPEKFAGPLFHILSGYTLIGAFFLLTEDSSSPVNFLAMILYGTLAGVLTMLIRNTGYWLDGSVFAILLANISSPLIDKIRPKALGKVDNYA